MSKKSHTPMMLLIKFRYLDLSLYAIHHSGADVNAIDSTNGNTLLHIFLASAKDMSETIHNLVTKHKADTTKTNYNGQTSEQRYQTSNSKKLKFWQSSKDHKPCRKNYKALKLAEASLKSADDIARL